MNAMAKGSLEGSEILLLEDEPMLRKRLAAFLDRLGAQVTALDTLATARNAAASMPFDYAILDINLPDGSGLDLLREHVFGGATSVVVMTAEGSVQIAVEAMRIGASDFLSKPVDPEALVLVLARARKAGQSQRIDQYEASRAPDDDTIFFGKAMKPVHDQLEVIRQAEARLTTGIPPVLIEGETGTGKTTVARWLHDHSKRVQMPYVDVNCSALPEQLAESELFGHERGSFTDAKEARIGLFEAADGGTLFLDEIPSLSPALQAKVLKAVEEGRIRRVGASRDIAVDVRLIAASNRDLRELSAKGEFREDLLQRLDLLRVKLTPLRDWGDDIGRLAGHLLKGLAHKYRLGELHISPAGLKRLQAWRWPGNIRELSHEIERAVVLSMGGEDLDFSNLPCTNPSASNGANASTPAGDDWFVESFRFPEEGGFDMETAILRLINHALAQTDGNVSAAARLLGVPRDYIRYRIKKA
jgi:two-component system, NtrC family, response regulator AtoC